MNPTLLYRRGTKLQYSPIRRGGFFGPLDGKDASDEQDWIKVDTKEKCSLVNLVF